MDLFREYPSTEGADKVGRDKALRKRGKPNACCITDSHVKVNMTVLHVLLAQIHHKMQGTIANEHNTNDLHTLLRDYYILHRRTVVVKETHEKRHN